MAVYSIKKFYVIKFLELPFWNINRYVCVPDSWILKRSVNQQVYATYPREDPDKTMKRAESYETPLKDWKMFKALIKYETDDYADAEIWITTEGVEQSSDDEVIVEVGSDDSTNDTGLDIEMEHNNASKRSGSLNTLTRGESSPRHSASSHLSNSFAGLSKVPFINNYLSHAQEMIVSKSTNKQNVTRATLTPSNHLHQSSKSPRQQRVTVVSEDFLRYGCSKQAPVLERSIERNDSDQGTRGMRPAPQSLIILMNRQSQSSQIKQENTSLIINGNPPQHGLEIMDTNTDMNHISQRAHSQDVSKNIPSALQKFTNTTSKHWQKKQNSPVYTDNSLQNSARNKVVVTSSTRLRLVDDKKPRQSIKKNAPFALENSSNLANNPGQIFNQSDEQSPPTYNVIVQQDSEVNKIIITKANDQIIPSQSITKNKLYSEQNFLNIGNQLCRMPEYVCEKQFPPVSNEHWQQNLCVDNMIFRTTNGNTPLDLLKPSRNNINGTSPPLKHFRSVENQFSHLPKDSNEIYNSADLQNDARKVTYTHRSFAGVSSAVNYFNQRPRLRGTTQNTTSTNQLRQISGNANQQQPIAVLKDRCNDLLFVSKALEENGHNQRPSVQSTTQIVPPAVETVSTSANQSNVDSSNQGISAVKMPVNKLNGLKYIAQSSRLETAKEDGSVNNLNPPKVINGLESASTKTEQILLNDFKLLFSQMNSSLSSTLEAFKDIRNTIVEHDKTFQQVIERVTNLCESKIKEALAFRSRKVAKPQNKRRKMMKYGGDNDDNYCDDDDNDEYYKPPKKKDNKNCSFVLPPEYNPKNSRWTLKYRKASAEIVEVMPRSRVYIDAIKFAHCKRTARDCKTLARMLLPEIFTKKALRVCSLTGARAKAFEGAEVRPGLDEHARIVLLTFVTEFGRQNGWVVYDTQSILNSVRNKIQELRKK